MSHIIWKMLLGMLARVCTGRLAPSMSVVEMSIVINSWKIIRQCVLSAEDDFNIVIILGKHC